MDEFKSNYINFNGSNHQRNKRCIFDLLKYTNDNEQKLSLYVKKIKIQHNNLLLKISEISMHLLPNQIDFIEKIKTNIINFDEINYEQNNELNEITKTINNTLNLKKIKDKHVENIFQLYQKFLNFNKTLEDIDNMIDYNAFNKIHLKIVQQISDLSLVSNLLEGEDTTIIDMKNDNSDDKFEGDSFDFM